MPYSNELGDQIFVKGYWFFSFVIKNLNKNIGKNISENMSNKYTSRAKTANHW